MNGFQDALKQACAIAGLEAERARLLRIGSNAVYRLADPVVARISRPGAGMDHVRRTVAVARWLESADYPAVRVVDVDQPILVGGYVVTFWKAISDDGDQYASTREVGEMLVRLHALAAPEELHLPQLAPFGNAAQRIDASTWLSEDDRSFLTMMLAGIREAYANLKFVLQPGVIHGDASVGNVLRDAEGRPVLTGPASGTARDPRADRLPGPG
jgi:Phosphotransferase enzyme family